MSGKTIKILQVAVSLVVIAGAYLKLSHYDFGYQMVLYGLIAYSVLSEIENNQLKKMIRNLKKEKV